jgi:exopolyphosphatase / guanosine-5'-triphosphate,3'-diphosphate pyrophosphatase
MRAKRTRPKLLLINNTYVHFHRNCRFHRNNPLHIRLYTQCARTIEFRLSVLPFGEWLGGRIFSHQLRVALGFTFGHRKCYLGNGGFNRHFKKKKSMTIAVIDLGTNGFRLQIAETFEQGKYRIIHKEANELKMAAEGIHRIGDAPFQRGVETMRHFSTVLKQHNVLKIKAFATAAVRMADNGQHFIETVKTETGIAIELISGVREAELIYKGMSTSTPLSIKPILMVDVGGGSVELIIGNRDGILWAHSFNIGVAILKQKFHKNDPITLDEIAAIETFLEAETPDFIAQLRVFQPEIPLIACGTLDFMVKILRGGYENNACEISKTKFDDFYQNLVFSTDADLHNMPNMPKDKIEMLAVSLVLMDWIQKKMNAPCLMASANSMKAGILYEMTFEC